MKWIPLVLLPFPALASTYNDGQQDWNRFKIWEQSIGVTAEPFAEGERYWIANRNRGGNCAYAAPSSPDPQLFNMGCQKAVEFMAPIDARRLNPEYKSGFNDAAKMYPHGGVPLASIPPNVTIVDNPPVDAQDLCKAVDETVEKIARREINDAVSVSAEYSGGRYLGNNVYKCLYRLTVSGHVGQDDITMSHDSVFKVEYMGQTSLVTDETGKDF